MIGGIKKDGKKSRGRVYKRIDLTGQKFGRLLVLKYSHDDPLADSISIWECICDCGNTSYVRIGALRKGRIKSCGCISKESDKRVKHPLHHVWRSLKQRVLNPKDVAFKRYGGRGIFVCKRWADSYVHFYEDLISIYERGLQIDRINNDGGYEPGNVRFVDSRTNMRNRSNTKLNVEDVKNIRASTKMVSEIAKIYGVAKNTIYSIRNKKCKSWRDAW